MTSLSYLSFNDHLTSKFFLHGKLFCLDTYCPVPHQKKKRCPMKCVSEKV